ncbi:helix-turn-helix transcriptional regulator [Novosphingobium sp.]|uniref:helix-turn-helix transcriptional regulator n=1 Tax=Novosphingobium sp. TaxID=1874826 RepID=UPI0035B13ED6
MPHTASIARTSKLRPFTTSSLGSFALLGLQAIAAIYFIFDSIADFHETQGSAAHIEIMMEGLVALALATGVALAARQAITLLNRLRHSEQTLQLARGALAEHVERRFADWGLSPGEGEVALFAIKGCSIAEIAGLRDSAAGTIRSQLSQIYAKAGVASQAGLIAGFLEDLLDLPPQPGT